MAQRLESDEGMSLVEVVVAMAIVTVGLLGMLTEIVTYFHQQTSQRAHAVALRIATTALEDSRRVAPGTLPLGTSTSQPQVKGNVSYTTTTTVQMCAPTDQTTCTTPAAGAASVARVAVSVGWTDARGSHHVALSTADADTGYHTLAGSSPGLLTNASGASGTSVSASALGLSPSSVSVDSHGNPLSNVTASLSITGLSTSVTVPLTWSDDNGAHQASMSNVGGTTWSVTVSKSSITHMLSSGSGTVSFAATVPGIQVFPTASLTVTPQATFVGSCTVTASPIVLTPLTRKTSLAELFTCTTSGLTTSDSVQAVYASGSGTATLTLSSINGSTWTATLPAGTSMASSGSTENITYRLTRASDGTITTQSASVALA